jgi:hypothetical protein
MRGGSEEVEVRKTKKSLPPQILLEERPQMGRSQAQEVQGGGTHIYSYRSATHL